MRASLNNATTSDGYSDAAAVQLSRTKRIDITISNAAVYYQVDASPDGDGFWSDETFQAPAIGPLAMPCSGIRFRSALAGAPAQVAATLYDEDELDGFGGLTAFTQRLAASGGVEGGGLQTGTVDLTIVGAPGVGGVAVVFSTPFTGADPVVVLAIEELTVITNPSIAVYLTDVSLTGFTVEGRIPAGSADETVRVNWAAFPS